MRYTSIQIPYRLAYHINDMELTTKTTHRDLGVLMSNDLCWKHHYENLLMRAYKSLGLLRRIFCNISCSQAKKVLFLSLVHSQLQYCSPIWRPHYIKDIKSIENVQRRTTKFILNSDYKSRLLKLHLLSIMMQLEIWDIIFFVKNLRVPSTYFI